MLFRNSCSLMASSNSLLLWTEKLLLFCKYAGSFCCCITHLRYDWGLVGGWCCGIKVMSSVTCDTSSPPTPPLPALAGRSISNCPVLFVLLLPFISLSWGGIVVECCIDATLFQVTGNDVFCVWAMAWHGMPWHCTTAFRKIVHCELRHWVNLENRKSAGILSVDEMLRKELI